MSYIFSIHLLLFSVFSIPTTAVGSRPTNDITEDASTTTSVSATTPRPTHFPGEEDEVELFSEASCFVFCPMYFLCLRLTQFFSNVFQLSPPRRWDSITVIKFISCVQLFISVSLFQTDSPPVKPAPQMKFKKQGEGLLKLLAPKDVTNVTSNGTSNGTSSDTDKENTSCKKRRLVLRQKGTWTLLLNSPLWLSKKFELMSQMSSGYGVRFVGLDHTSNSQSISIFLSIPIFFSILIPIFLFQFALMVLLVSPRTVWSLIATSGEESSWLLWGIQRLKVTSDELLTLVIDESYRLSFI